MMTYVNHGDTEITENAQRFFGFIFPKKKLCAASVLSVSLWLTGFCTP